MSHHVFLVDDDAALNRLASLILRTDGFEITSFGLPVVALEELLDSSRPDPIAVILDLNMPGLDGRTFFRRARAGGYSGPFVILSAFGARDAQRELGAEAAVSKPFLAEVLIEVLRRVLSHDGSSPHSTD